MSTYYEVLEVSESATKEEIKKAYRRLAKKWHPDMNPDTDTTEKFVGLEVAYSALFDAKSRAAYDRLLRMEREHINNPGLNRKYAQTVRRRNSRARSRARQHSQMSYNQYKRDESFRDSYLPIILRVLFFGIVASAYFYMIAVIAAEHSRELQKHIEPTYPSWFVGLIGLMALPVLIVASYLYEPLVNAIIVGKPKGRRRKGK